MLALELILLVVVVAFICEYADSTFGMGYGTTMTPILLLAGFEPLQLVPIVLMSEMITGATAGFFHHKEGNCDLKAPQNLKIVTVLSVCSVIGTIAAVVLAVQLPKFWIKLYITVLVLAIGIFTFLTRNRIFTFAWSKIWVVGSLASFNKGISGGGYGPLVCPGQILSGVPTKSAIVITSVSESITCLVGIIMYLLVSYQEICWPLLPWILIGAIASVPLSAKSVKLVSEKMFRLLIAGCTLFLGLFLLIKQFAG